MAAEPVPVRRPGVRATGVLVRADGSEKSEAEYTGSTKIGLNLRGIVCKELLCRLLTDDLPERQP